MAPLEPTPSLLFADHFGRLIGLLRREPSNVPAQKNALQDGMAVLARGPVLLEAGIEYSEAPDEGSLKGRLLLRQVDWISLSANASADEVLALAHALASDSVPLARTPGIQVENLPASGMRNDLTSTPLVAEQAETIHDTPTRSRTMSGPAEESERLAAAMERAMGKGRWMEALHAAQALVRLAPRFPEHERRGFHLALRRVLSRRVLEEFIQFALRATEEQPRVTEVLQAGGPEAIELMVDQLIRSESVGPRRFLYDLLAGTPDALPMLLPLLTSPRWHEVRHGVELLGRLAHPDSIMALRAAANHPDERVRKAVVEALARFNQNSVVEQIRRALSDSSPGTRASAAQALAERHSPGLAVPLIAALETEKEPEAWAALVEALARIDTSESTGVLVALALDRRPILSTGRPMSQRLAIVRALSKAGTVAADRALERLAREADGLVKKAAAEARRGTAKE